MNKKFNFSILVTLLIMSGTFAYTPTVEGLLLNPANGPMIGKDLKLTWDIRVISPASESKYVLITSLGSEFKQTVYDGLIKPSNLIESNEFPLTVLENSMADNKLPRLLWSTVRMVGQNDMRFLLQFLKESGFSFNNNGNLINREKLSAMRSYRDLLKVNGKYDDKVKASPEMVKLKNYINEPYFVDNNAVELNLKDGELYWKVKSGQWDLYFGHEDHRLAEIQDTQHGVTIYLSGYQLIDTENFFPENIRINHGLNTYILKAIKVEAGKGNGEIVKKARGAGSKHLPFIF